MTPRNDPKYSRRRALLAQTTQCFYCKRETNPSIKELVPVAEHYTPRHAKPRHEKHDVVLACAWCDKAKGMLHGEEFMCIVIQATGAGNTFKQAQPLIAARAKKANVAKFSKYLPKNAPLANPHLPPVRPPHSHFLDAAKAVISKATIASDKAVLPWHGSVYNLRTHFRREFMTKNEDRAKSVALKIGSEDSSGDLNRVVLKITDSISGASAWFYKRGGFPDAWAWTPL